MIIKTRGIVFRAIKYSETSLIVDIYTEAKGLRKYIISGVRSKKARVNASLLQPMTLLDLVVYHRNDKSLTRIKELRPAKVFQSIPFDLKKGSVGLFMVEVAQKTLRESEENQALFEFLYETFSFLDETQQSVSNLHLSFLSRLSGYLGFMPSDDFSAATPYFDLQEGTFSQNLPNHRHHLDEDRSRLFFELLEKPMEEIHDVKMSSDIRRIMLNNLLDYYRLHLENFPTINSHSILQQVLEDV